MSLPDGRRISGYGKDQAQARQRCLEKVALADQGVDYRVARQKVSDYFAWWLADVAAPRCSAKTHRMYSDLVRLHIAPELGRLDVGKLSMQQIQSLLRTKERDGLSPRTVARIRGVLRTALNDSVRLGVLARNVAALTDPPRRQSVEREPFTAEEARSLLAAATVAVLRAHHDRQGCERKAAGARWRESGHVFTTSIGTSIDPDRLTKENTSLLTRAGLRDQRVHDLRHTPATLMLRNGLPVHEVSPTLGHSQTSTTLNDYSHVLPGGNDRAAAMDRLLG